MAVPKIIALIPARSGSKRIKDKNIKKLGGHPLIAYSIRAALDCEIFDSVVCATDSELYSEIAIHYGAEVPFLRTNDISEDNSPDIQWIRSMLLGLKELGREFDFFCILRPTSPFRLPQTILRAWESFMFNDRADSLRAVEKCSQHPGKMWVKRNDFIFPIMPFEINGTPWHSNQYSALPEVFVQNASLEIGSTKLVLENETISGEIVMPFQTEGFEGFDINFSEDFTLAENYICSEINILPTINKQSYFDKLNNK
jgi:CMP-N,N'-diacetyllegionaminic acid synthase